MKATISKNELKNILANIQGLTGRKSNLAITENVLIQTSQGNGNGQGPGIKFAATDLETGFEGFLPAAIEIDGAIAIHAKRLYDIVREYPADAIPIHEVENRWIEIGADKTKFHTVGMQPDDFPDIPHVDTVSFFTVDADTLTQAIERTVHVKGAVDDDRAHVVGIHIAHIPDENLIRLTSTDAARLSFADLAYSEAGELPEPEIGGNKEILIPKKGLAEARKMLAGAGSVKIGVGGGHFVIQIDGGKTSLFIRLLEGDFPDCEQFVKMVGTGDKALCDIKALTAMVKRMKIFSTEQYRGVLATFDAFDGVMRLVTSNPDIGESRDEISIEYDGPAVETAFNPGYILDAVASVGWGEKVTLEIHGNEGPMIIYGDDSTFTGVVMPMRL